MYLPARFSEQRADRLSQERDSLTSNLDSLSAEFDREKEKHEHELAERQKSIDALSALLERCATATCPRFGILSDSTTSC